LAIVTSAVINIGVRVSLLYVDLQSKSCISGS
jgi:hypothetical protein